MCPNRTPTRLGVRVLVTWLLTGVSAAAFAQPAASPQNSFDPEETFRQLDANKDGKLTSDEGGSGSQQFVRRLLDMAGKKETDSLSKAEFLKIAEEHRRRGGGGTPPPANGSTPRPNPTPMEDESADRLPALLRALDSNRDGKLSRAELNRLNERFNTWDTNQDGQLDLNELRAINEGNAAPRSPSETPSPNRPSSPRGTSTSGNRGSASSEPSRSSGSTSSTGNRPAASNADGTVRQRLAGTWRGWVVDGRGANPNSGQMEMELRIEGNRMVGREVGTNRAPQGPGLGEGTFTVSGDHLDAVGTGGPTGGRDFPGIFELDGDTLRWCVSNRGRNHPKAFETGTGNYLMVLRRQN